MYKKLKAEDIKEIQIYIQYKSQCTMCIISEKTVNSDR